MKGNNTITMNEATVIAAVQMYLDAQFKDGAAPEVLSVKGSTTGRYGTEGCFEISTTERVTKS